ncbi:MAG: phosphatidate cytidylyltransferase [Psychrobacter sp.]|uniref:phosphatidate cytidylyltransferase n=1 Tax=Psychrobacter sp. CCUG 69069 TaxID=2282777 RepID=UPI001E41B5A7|nr:phosphatidate cytidylyltransferase [Psychrobacter sp. CCUG 69069]MCD1279182.1 phosphatidate cytidylyltransferase [Psychrobacter sp. CCUG 69069]MCD6252011.1 phosphatidate cytidylyltransferase [Psychrobacter sp.]|tara:strand:- start:10305 stop:11114 length:810 start_codon:yes stop_codon:yes gene_type:complete
MWQRIKTAIVLVIIVGIAMFASQTPILFAPLLAIGVIIAAHEWTKLMPKWRQPMLYVLLVLVITLVSLIFKVTWLFWWVASLAIWLMALSWVKVFPTHTNWYGKKLALMGAVILTAAITAMFYLWQLSAWWLLYVFLLVWSADSGAYFVGRKLGRRKMAPNVSPNKSVEGLTGGLVTGLLVVIGISVFKLQLTGMSLIAFVALSALTILASVLGDLFESMLKRRADIKDSGNMLPGHGGVLDRIDSLLAATPIFALGFWAIQQLGLIVV